MRCALPAYTPNAAQCRFHIAANRSDNGLWLAGVGTGKTMGGAHEFCRRVVSEPGGTVHLLSAPSRFLLERNSWSAVKRWFQDFRAVNGVDLVDRMVDNQSGREIRLVNGSTIIAFINKNYEDYAGVNATQVWLDEVCIGDVDGFDVWKHFDQRLRDLRSKRRRMFGTSTPNGRQALVAWFQLEASRGDGQFSLVFGRTIENAANQPADYLPRILRGLSPRIARQQTDAEILSYEGAIYAEEFHLQESIAWGWRFEDRVEAGKALGGEPEVCIGIDWGEPTYPAAVLYCHYPDDTDIVFDEVVTDGLDEVKLLQELRSRLRHWDVDPWSVARIDCDPNPPSGKRHARQLFPKSLVRAIVDPKHQDIMTSTQVVQRRLLDHRKQRWLYLAPTLVSEDGRGLYRAFQQQGWEESRGQFGQRVRLPRLARSPFRHVLDALRYPLNNRYRRVSYADATPYEPRSRAS